MKISKAAFIFAILLILFPFTAFSESSFHDDYKKGKEAYLNSMYDRAVTHFENALPYSTPEFKPVIHYWTGQSYMALRSYSKAENTFNNLIENYPGTEESINALYQKGRIFFIKEDYEKSIEYMHSFLEKSGENNLNGNAYFWIGESLFFLGHKAESLVLYNKVIKEYPESYKFEASNYRAQLIKLGKREEELMKLLKWSHEESLKERELFIKKEKEYKQAILSYQKKLSILSDNDINNEVLILKETNRVLKKQIAAMQGEIEKHKKDIDILKKMDDDKKSEEGKTGITPENTISEPVNEKQ